MRVCGMHDIKVGISMCQDWEKNVSDMYTFRVIVYVRIRKEIAIIDDAL